MQKKACVFRSICHYIGMTIKKFINWFIAKIKSVFSRTLTFRDLVFTDHANVNAGIQAKLDLGNDLEISVVSMKKEGYGLYGDASAGTYEVAMFRKNTMLPLGAFDDVLGWQTEDELNELMANFQGSLIKVSNVIDELYLKKSEKRLDLGLD